jgi:hypothetical protein
VVVQVLTLQELRRRAVHFRYLARTLSDENAMVTALILSNEYEEEALAVLKGRVEYAEQLVANQIACVKELDRHGITATAIARCLLETFETSLDLSKAVFEWERDVCERAAADLD